MTPPRQALWLLALGLAWPAWAQDRFGDLPAAAPARPAAPAAVPTPAPSPAAPARGRLAAPAAPPGGPAQAAVLAQLDALEREEHGVAPTAALHTGPMHGKTPASIPGARLVTTRELLSLLQPAGGPSTALVFDVLGGPERLPAAIAAVPAAQAGSFDDAVQQAFGQYLQQVTQGSADRPLVFYCASLHCWMSYNAALRAARLGYRQVLWYRGGLQAWKEAGLPVQTAQAGAGPR